MNNTLLQRLDSAANTTGSSTYASNRHLEEVFVAYGAISAGDFVSLSFEYDDDGTPTERDDSDKLLFVQKADNAAVASSVCVGVAIADAAEAENVRVLVRGIISANVATGSTEGLTLAISGTAGRAALSQQFLTDSDGTGATAQARVQQIVGIALEDAVDNVAKVYVSPKF